MRLGKFGFIVVALVLFYVLPAFAADVAKIGIIDFQRVLTESEAGKSVQEEIQKKGREMETSLIELGKAIEGLSEQMSREAMVMSKEKREEKQREIEIKKYDFQSLQKKYQMEFRELEAIEVEKLKNDIFELAEKIGKKEGYLLIIEKSAAIYYPSTIDITDLLIEKYNETSKGSN
ncbi:MAG: OmpH family outer membrane protein [Desulfobacteraceae bacterium]|nr:OmpH family outer membrane protein [Desulfobacteraceae bacterium]MBC2755313.1 OmpH family outer membrane protein [Desulfobacteraceae bacterium]